ncbi:MAG: hypothetical protein KJO43_00700, partial [Phycisphaerae bacterium]|nr:hypothetical protein [Phycisphaerae bacterium]
LVLRVIERFTLYEVPEKAILTLRNIVTVALTINTFLLLSELFTEFYTDSQHVASATYLYFGLHGYTALVPWIWTAVALNTIALIMLYLPLARSLRFLNLACVMLIAGIWIEKGMGLIVPAFIPSPLGEIVEYVPTLNELLVCAGIWAFGLLLYTIFVRITVPVLSGRLTYDTDFDPETENHPIARGAPEGSVT